MNTTATAPTHCTQADFARLLKCERSYVTKLKHEGRLVLGEAGRVDVQASLARIKATTGAPERAAEPVQGPAYADAQDRERFYSSELKRLEYLRQMGQLLEAADVASVVADAAALIASTIDGWRNLLPAQLAALGADEGRIAALLADECEQLRRRVAAKFAHLAGEGADAQRR